MRDVTRGWPSIGKFADIPMLMGTGGRERTVNELLPDGGFPRIQVISVQELMIIGAEPE